VGDDKPPARSAARWIAGNDGQSARTTDGDATARPIAPARDHTTTFDTTWDILMPTPLSNRGAS
jgi:hypothetical protein